MAGSASVVIMAGIKARGDRCLSAENVLFLRANKTAIAFSSGKTLGVKVFQNLNAEIPSNAGSISERDHCESTFLVLICQRLSKEASSEIVSGR